MKKVKVKVKLKYEDNVRRSVLLASWLIMAMEQKLLPNSCTITQVMKLVREDSLFIKADNKKADAKTWKKSWK